MAEVVMSSESWARSVPSENVQGLAQEMGDTCMEIPERYIRPELDVGVKAICDDDDDEGGSDHKVPIIDMKRLLDPNFSLEESAKLHSACMDWGFFQVVNHGVSDEVIENIKVDLEEFFKLPLKEKEAFAPQPGGLQGYGQKLVRNYEEKLEWQDRMFLITQPLHDRNFTLWPTSPPTFRSTLDIYSTEIKSVSRCLVEIIAKNLGLLDPEVLCGILKDDQSMRLNYYPPCPKANQVLGFNPHSDASGLTLLLQIRDVQGLQIKRKGKWLPVQPLENALVVNIGDALEILTNGKYASVEHRVTVNNKKERLSIATFHSPSFDQIIGPLPEPVQESGEEYYKTMKYGKYMKLHFSTKVEDNNHMEFMKLNK